MSSNVKIPWCRIETGTASPRITWSASEFVAWLRNYRVEIVGHCTFKASDYRKAPATYANNKAAIEQLAHDWESYANEASMSYSEFADWYELFETLGRRFGLLAEFRENAIC